MRKFVLTLALGALAVAAAAAPPAEGQAGPGPDEAMVRFLHAAPNAQPERIVLTGADGNVEPEAFAGVSYGELTDYVPVPVGGYEVTYGMGGEGDAAAEVTGDTLDLFAGEYYTIALIGLVQPTEDQAQEGEGFFEWLEGLFTSDEDAYRMRTVVISDGTTTTVAEDEAELRIAHFAPGTDALDLVAVREGGEVDVLHTVGYGEVSGFGNVPSDVTSLEIRAQGSEAVVFDLSQVEIQAGASSTLFLTGTPVEQVPLDVTVAPNPQVNANVAGGMATPPGAAVYDATQVTFLRDSLAELEARLAAIEDRLASLRELDGAQEDVDAAQQEVDEAMALIAAARDQMDAQQPGVPPAEPAGEGDGG